MSVWEEREEWPGMRPRNATRRTWLGLRARPAKGRRSSYRALWFLVLSLIVYTGLLLAWVGFILIVHGGCR